VKAVKGSLMLVMVRILTKQLNNMQGYARYLRLAMNMGRYGQVPFPK